MKPINSMLTSHSKYKLIKWECGSLIWEKKTKCYCKLCIEVIQVGEELPYNLVLPCSIFSFFFFLCLCYFLSYNLMWVNTCYLKELLSVTQHKNIKEKIHKCDNYHVVDHIIHSMKYMFHEVPIHNVFLRIFYIQILE